MSAGTFFFNDTATTEISTLSLHDALPIYPHRRAALPGLRRAERDRDHPRRSPRRGRGRGRRPLPGGSRGRVAAARSEEHTSELQSRQYLVCRLLLEKKNKPVPL